jgi:hypothetical protein
MQPENRRNFILFPRIPLSPVSGPHESQIHRCFYLSFVVSLVPSFPFLLILSEVFSLMVLPTCDLLSCCLNYSKKMSTIIISRTCIQKSWIIFQINKGIPPILERMPLCAVTENQLAVTFIAEGPF